MEVISRMTGTYMHLRKVPHMTIAVHHGRETALIGSDRWKMNTIYAANVAAFFRLFIAYFIHAEHKHAYMGLKPGSLATLRTPRGSAVFSR